MSELDALRARCSRLGFGCASYWAKPLFAGRRARSLVHEAIDLGISVFDTGPMYAAGEGERRLGQALRGRERERLVLMSKAGEAPRPGEPKDFSRAAIERSVEGSLRRLATDGLDVLWLHGCPRSDWNDTLRDTLLRIKDRGLAVAVGLNTFDAADIDASIDEPSFDALMFDVHVFRPDNAVRAERAVGKGKLVFSAAALARAPWRRNWWQVRSPADAWYWMRHRASAMPTEPAAETEVRVEAAAGRDESRARQALNWVLSRTAVDCALFNTTRLQHLRENAACMRGYEQSVSR